MGQVNIAGKSHHDFVAELLSALVAPTEPASDKKERLATLEEPCAL